MYVENDLKTQIDNSKSSSGVILIHLTCNFVYTEVHSGAPQKAFPLDAAALSYCSTYTDLKIVVKIKIVYLYKLTVEVSGIL